MIPPSLHTTKPVLALLLSACAPLMLTGCGLAYKPQLRADIKSYYDSGDKLMQVPLASRSTYERALKDYDSALELWDKKGSPRTATQLMKAKAIIIPNAEISRQWEYEYLQMRREELRGILNMPSETGTADAAGVKTPDKVQAPAPPKAGNKAMPPKKDKARTGAQGKVPARNNAKNNAKVATKSGAKTTVKGKAEVENNMARHLRKKQEEQRAEEERRKQQKAKEERERLEKLFYEELMSDR